MPSFINTTNEAEEAQMTRSILQCNRLGSAAILVLSTFAVLPASRAQQGPCATVEGRVTVSKGFYTGVELNALSDHDLGMYAAGYVDALQAATMIGVTEPCRRALQACAVGRVNSELAAMVRRYLRENPNRWEGQSNALLYNAIFSQCLRERP
jgi:hypothetical protein